MKMMTRAKMGAALASLLLMAGCGMSAGDYGSESSDDTANSSPDTESRNDGDRSSREPASQNNAPADEGYTGGAQGDAAAPPADADGDYQSGENYEDWEENDFIETATETTSTFSIDVDNAAYTIMRRDLNNSVLPRKETVRTEEYINYFDYGYDQPSGDDPFSIDMEMAPSEFGTQELDLLRIGLQGRDIDIADMKPTNLVFLIDVSGSMSSGEKLAMVKESLDTLLDNLRPTDTVGIVVYAGAVGVVLPPTEVQDRAQIDAAIQNLAAGGSTNGEAGIVTAYDMAEQAKIEGGNNRVILCTDGDFNVGKTGDALVEMVANYRDRHISLTTVGYGMGNYNGATMENLAKDGNGNYFYVDSLDEARRIFGSALPSTLEVIASDVKIQVEFDADNVKRYRLVGYENRVLDNEDFDDDTKDAGEIGPGHNVTALYELELAADAGTSSNTLATVRLRHKSQYGESSQLQQQVLKVSQIIDDFSRATDGFRFAAAVAEFAEILRESSHSQGDRFQDVHDIAAGATDGNDAQKQEFLQLVQQAQSLWPRQ